MPGTIMDLSELTGQIPLEQVEAFRQASACLRVTKEANTSQIETCAITKRCLMRPLS